MGNMSRGGKTKTYHWLKHQGSDENKLRPALLFFGADVFMFSGLITLVFHWKWLVA